MNSKSRKGDEEVDGCDGGRGVDVSTDYSIAQVQAQKKVQEKAFLARLQCQWPSSGGDLQAFPPPTSSPQAHTPSSPISFDLSQTCPLLFPSYTF